jgi:hypothetical protein
VIHEMTWWQVVASTAGIGTRWSSMRRQWLWHSKRMGRKNSILRREL